MEKDSIHPQEAPASVVTSFFERAHEPQWVGRLAMAVLFADIVLVSRTGSGIRHWAFDGAAILLNAGMLLVGALALGILSAFVLPVANVFLQQVVLVLHSVLSSWLKTDRVDHRVPLNCVHSSQFHEHVLRTKDPVLWEVWKDHAAQRRRRGWSPLAATQLPFSIWVLACADLLLPGFGVQGQTLLIDVAATLGEQGSWIFGSVLAISLWGLCSVWCTSSDGDYVYYPPLYEEIQSRRRTK